MSTLITGGARSGKSLFAESLFKNNDQVTYVASYVVDQNDLEMLDRIAKHQSQRNANWSLKEVNTKLDLKDNKFVLFDCLAIFTSNVLFSYSKDLAKVDADTFDLILEHLKQEIDYLLSNNQEVIIVTNEVGSSITPMNHLERVYRDLLGKINTYTASKCQTVYLVVCGIEIKIKGE